MRSVSIMIIYIFVTITVLSEMEVCDICRSTAFAAEGETLTSINENWSIHFQATSLSQFHPSFTSPYSGTNSLSGQAETRTSLTSTLFLGRSLWKGGEIYFNPELSVGSGVSDSHGVAGYTNGEVYRVDNPDPKVNLSRLYFKQVLRLGGEAETIEADKNQLLARVNAKRLTVIGGKFSLNDFFDNNSYSHDPRTQFMNWALMDNGAWDYAADTRGYTWALMVEYHDPKWSIRLATAMEPKEANQMDLDTNIAQAHGENLEIEYHYQILNYPGYPGSGYPGTARLLGYMNHAHMGSYEETLSNPAFGMDITRTRDYRTKYGLGLNLEQEITPDLGVFSRIGWGDGSTETWAFTEIDYTVSVGASLKGSAWHRPRDVIGLALIMNGLSKAHADYLTSGGYGFIIGDGKLNYAPEQIIEAYYLWKPFSGQPLHDFNVSGDLQFVNHPAYNQDRGPVWMYAARLHYEL